MSSRLKAARAGGWRVGFRVSAGRNGSQAFYTNMLPSYPFAVGLVQETLKADERFYSRINYYYSLHKIEKHRWTTQFL